MFLYVCNEKCTEKQSCHFVSSYTAVVNTEKYWVLSRDAILKDLLIGIIILKFGCAAQKLWANNKSKSQNFGQGKKIQKILYFFINF